MISAPVARSVTAAIVACRSCRNTGGTGPFGDSTVGYGTLWNMDFFYMISMVYFPWIYMI